MTTKLGFSTIEVKGEKMTEISNQEILKFVEYVDSFYNTKTGVFPLTNLSVSQIVNAIYTYITSLDETKTWGGGDSVDRERVRDIILAQNENVR